MLRNFLIVAVVGIVLSACSSVSQIGILSKPSADPISVITKQQSFKELGFVEGRACRYFLLAVIPFGDSTTGRAMEKALAQGGGDAIINASVTTSLYGFVPIYNVFSFACTTVRGTAIKYDTT